MSSTYLLRDVADDLWKRVKVRAARDEISIREVILRLLTYYAKHGLPEYPHTPGPGVRRPSSLARI